MTAEEPTKGFNEISKGSNRSDEKQGCGEKKFQVGFGFVTVFQLIWGVFYAYYGFHNMNGFNGGFEAPSPRYANVKERAPNRKCRPMTQMYTTSWVSSSVS